MKIALLGFSQAGKKTLFSLLTGRTLRDMKPGESVEGIAPIRDERVDRLTEMYSPKKKVYAENAFMLCPDFSGDDGEHRWLSSARKSDLICLVLRAFESENVYHPAGSVDPERDRRDLVAEMLLADMQIAEKRLNRIEKERKAGLSTVQILEEQTLKKCMTGLERENPISNLELERHEMDVLRSLELITVKPVLCVYNVSDNCLSEEYGPSTVAVSCEIEREIMTIEDQGERREYMEAMGLKSSGLDRVNSAAYDALGLMSFYTTGKDECRAWTIRKGSTAPAAGGKVHSDIERGFIRVEIIKYDDLMDAGSEQEVKHRGKVHLKGKDYVIQDGDICHFLFNV